MLGKTFAVLMIAAFICAVITGNIEELASGAIDGAAKSVTVTLSLCGMMCLWSGVLRVLREAGAIGAVKKLISPLLRFAFPRAWRSGEGIDSIAANISANMLGMGNAATPFALSALSEMKRSSPLPDAADNEMITLTVLAVAPVCLMPVNLLALRAAAGGAGGAVILAPVWVVSGSSFLFALLLCRALSAIFPDGRHRKSKKPPPDKAGLNIKSEGR